MLETMLKVGVVVVVLVTGPQVIDYVLATRVRGFGTSSDDPELRRIFFLIALADSLAILAALFVTSLGWPGPQWKWLIIGIAVTYAGVALRYWAIVTLGRFFEFVVTIQNDHRVVTSGPYRLMRHPAYTGLVMVQLGIGIALANSLSVVLCLAIMMLALIPRIHREESVLLGELGTEYADYAAKTKRLIPKVW